MRWEPADDRQRRSGAVPGRVRPTEARAAAAARLAGGHRSDTARRRAEETSRRPENRRGAAAGGWLANLSGRAGEMRPGRPAHPAGSRRAGGPSRPAQRRAVPQERAASVGAPEPRRVPARAMANPSAVTGGYGAVALAAARPETVPQEHRRPRHLRVVEPGTLSASQRRRRARALLVTTIGAATVIAFALVYFHVVLAQRQFQIDRLNANVSKAQTSYQNLRLKVAELGSPQQIISTAEGSLGMVQPSKVVYLTPSAAQAAGGTASGRPSGATSVGASGGTSRAPGGVVKPASAPAGDANWPDIKSQLAGTP